MNEPTRHEKIRCHLSMSFWHRRPASVRIASVGYSMRTPSPWVVLLPRRHLFSSHSRVKEWRQHCTTCLRDTSHTVELYSWSCNKLSVRGSNSKKRRLTTLPRQPSISGMSVNRWVAVGDILMIQRRPRTSFPSYSLQISGKVFERTEFGEGWSDWFVAGECGR